MTNSLTNESDYLNALFKTAQYLSTLITPQDFWVYIKELIKEFYNVDLFYFYECGYDGKIFKLQKNFSNNQFSEKIFEQIKELLAQVMDSGFIASELINIPESYAIVLLPITKIKKIMGIMVIGHQRNELLPKYLLNIYLSLARLVSTIIDNLYMLEELKNSENRYKTLAVELEAILDHIPGAVVYKDTENNTLRVNKFFADAHNLKKVELENRSIFDLYSREIAQAYWEDDLEVINSKKPKVNIVEPWETDAGKRWVNTSKIPYIDENGNVKGIILLAFDITERMLAEQKLKSEKAKAQKAEEELKATLKDLKRSNTELEQFAYVASHDLQEPLRMVASFTQLLQNRYQDKLDDDANDFINFIVGGTTRMKSLINDLLIFSRVGTRAKLFKATDMNNVLEKALANVRQSIKDTNATITNDPLPVIIADDSQMLQLFQNLISNALKFHGEEDPHIHVSGEEVKEEEWIFSVRDNGIGIDSKNFDRIFVIFQCLHKKDEYGGTGIGLAVCKKIVKRHGGKIWVKSKLGKGSTFYFSIPKRELEKNEK